MTLDDLEFYRVEVTEPVNAVFTGALTGYEALTVPPPSSGGMTALEILHLFALTGALEQPSLSAEAVHEMLNNESYWARHRSLEQVKKSIATSICFGVYHGSRHLGFARVVTDYVTMFYLCDVIITEEYRGRGLGRMLMDAVFSFAEIQGLLGLLLTRSAHGLYRKYGFQSCEKCGERFMLLGSGWQREE